MFLFKSGNLSLVLFSSFWRQLIKLFLCICSGFIPDFLIRRQYQSKNLIILLISFELSELFLCEGNNLIVYVRNNTKPLFNNIRLCFCRQ